MANPQDLEKLCRGPKVWNAWREEIQDSVPDLRNASLKLDQRQFGPSNGGPVNLQDVDLGGAQLQHAILTGADLSNSNLIAANLDRARLDGADFSGADLTDAILDHADLTDAKFDGALLIGTSFANARGVTEEQIAYAHGNATTVLPDDVQPPESWFPNLEEDLFYSYEVAREPIHDSDPYQVLGVEASATFGQIRTAFRNLVKQVHPDLNPGNQEALETFKRVSIAYRILSHPDKKRRYDRGEIGGDGEITSEFEAKQQFRRYACRFYAAAAVSLCLAIGVLVTVWHTVLTHDGAETGRIEITVSMPPKQTERLGLASNRKNKTASKAGAEAPVAQMQDAAEHSNQEPAADKLATAPEAARLAKDGPGTMDEKSVTSTPDDDDDSVSEPTFRAAQDGIKRADDQPSPEIISGDNSGQHDRPAAANSERDAASPSEQSKRQASNVINTSSPSSVPMNSKIKLSDIPAAHRAQSANPSRQDGHEQEATSPKDIRSASLNTAPDRTGQLDKLTGDQAERDVQNEEPPVDQEHAYSLHGDLFLMKTKARKIAPDRVSDMLGKHAINKILATGSGDATASFNSAAPMSGQDEIWDIYTHSLPDSQSEVGKRPWPEILEKKKAKTVSLTMPPLPKAVPVQPAKPVSDRTPRQTTTEVSRRKQAISEILAGGL